MVRVSGLSLPRLTLTLPVLSASKMVLFLVAGVEKREALNKLVKGEDIPAARVEARRVLIVADRAASAETLRQ